MKEFATMANLPIHDRILCVVWRKLTTRGGIIIPDSAKTSREGEVISSVGPL